MKVKIKMSDGGFLTLTDDVESIGVHITHSNGHIETHTYVDQAPPLPKQQQLGDYCSDDLVAELASRKLD